MILINIHLLPSQNMNLHFYLIEKNYESFDTFFEKNDRDLIFEIGDIVANHKISTDLGISALKFYANSYDFMDNYPLATVYYLLSRIYFFKQDLNICSDYLAKALKINPKFQTALVFQKNINYEKVSFYCHRGECNE